LAATNDIRDGMTYLSPGSNHYMNVYGDASWEIAGRESHTDFTETLCEADAELPAIVGARGFSSHLIHFDTLHVLYRGVGPDFVASTLVLVFGQKLLPEAHELARSWCRAQGASLSVDDFTFSYEGRFPSLNAKGWDVRLLLLWLAEVVPGRTQGWADGEYAEVINMTVRAVAKSIRLMDEAEYVVPPEKIAKAEKYARHFLLGYMWLAFAASTAGQKLFKIRP
ncbi:unnamed protein product, partial [Symbiodinium pilosum]